MPRRSVSRVRKAICPRCRFLRPANRISRRIGRIFRYVRVHVIPWLGAFDEDIRVRPEPARIVEARDADADQIGPGRNLNVKRRAAIAAKYAGDLVAGVGSSDVASGLALDDAKLCGWDPNRSDKGAAALPLAIPAMALQRKNGFSGAFIADRTAQAPTGPQVCHTRLRRGLRCRIALVLSLRANDAISAVKSRSRTRLLRRFASRNDISCFAPRTEAGKMRKCCLSPISNVACRERQRRLA